MGAIISELVIGIIDGVTDATRESIAAGLRAAADRVERGDLVPEEALAQALADQSRIDSARERLRGK